MAMKKITVYKTTDGKIWDSKDQAAEHQSKLIRRSIIDEFVEKHFYYAAHLSDIVDILDNHIDELIEDLNR